MLCEWPTVRLNPFHTPVWHHVKLPPNYSGFIFSKQFCAMCRVHMWEHKFHFCLHYSQPWFPSWLKATFPVDRIRPQSARPLFTAIALQWSWWKKQISQSVGKICSHDLKRKRQLHSCSWGGRATRSPGRQWQANHSEFNDTEPDRKMCSKWKQGPAPDAL